MSAQITAFGGISVVTITDHSGKWVEVWACYRCTSGEMQAIMLNIVS